MPNLYDHLTTILIKNDIYKQNWSRKEQLRYINQVVFSVIVELL